MVWSCQTIDLIYTITWKGNYITLCNAFYNPCSYVQNVMK